jgi:erythromycin esterase-like protein
LDQEFYEERANITQRLINEKGFRIVVVEADWPDAYRVNRYLHSLKSSDANVKDALSDFQRFPKWMWRNEPVAAFLDWVKSFNDEKQLSEQVSFFGLDLYSLFKVRKPELTDRMIL